jgi:hypothetical protein
MEYLLKKAKEKKLIPFLLKSFAVLILILFLGWLFYLDFKVSIFYIEYKNKLRK